MAYIGNRLKADKFREAVNAGVKVFLSMKQRTKDEGFTRDILQEIMQPVLPYFQPQLEEDIEYMYEEMFELFENFWRTWRRHVKLTLARMKPTPEERKELMKHDLSSKGEFSADLSRFLHEFGMYDKIILPSA
jgi:hypothetical protein